MSILFALAASAVCGRPFELYQPIIDRCPFGDPPDDPTILPNQSAKSSNVTQVEVGEAELTQQQAELQQTVGVSVMNINPDGSVWVGFSVMGDQKTARHYYVAVGDQRDGWLIKEADPSKGTVMFVKDSIEVPRKIGDAIAKSSARGGGRQPPQRGGFGGRSPLIAGKPQQTDAPSSPTSMKSHRQLKREQEEAERKARLEQAEALKKMQEEREAEKAEREAEKAEREAEKAEREAQAEANNEEMNRRLLDLQDRLKARREGRGDAQEADE